MKNFLQNLSSKFQQILPKKRTENLSEDKINSEIKKEIDKSQIQSRNIDTMVMAKFWLIGLAVGIIVYIASQSLSAIYLIISAYIISVALESVVLFFRERGLSRMASIAIAYTILIILLLSGFIFVVPFLLSQTGAMIDSILYSIRGLQNIISTVGVQGMIYEASRLPLYAKEYLINLLSDPSINQAVQRDLQNNIAQIIGYGSTYAQVAGNLAVSIVTSFFSFLFQFTIIMVLAILFSIEKKLVMRFVAGLGGRENYDFVYAKLGRIYKRLGIRLQSQILLMFYIGGVVFVSLHILGLFGLSLPNKGSLALIAGLLEFVPYLGPFMGAIPAMIVAFIHFGLRGAFVVAILYGMIQWTENNVLIPLVMQKTLGISPLLIFICVIIGGLVMGFLGFVLGVPLAVIISMLYNKNE